MVEISSKLEQPAPSQRSTREWPLLVMTVALVGLICLPLWQTFSTDDGTSFLNWPLERWARLLLGPEQMACYVAFLWGLFIFASRFLETRRQRQAFRLGLLPVDEGARILQEDARPLGRIWIDPLAPPGKPKRAGPVDWGGPRPGDST